MNPPATASLAGLRVLVVEDSALVAMYVESVLLDAGCDVTLMPDMERARTYARSNAIDVAVLDINLRGERVFPLASELQQRQVGLVFSSGYTRDTPPSSLAEVPFLSKPIDPDALLHTVADVACS